MATSAWVEEDAQCGVALEQEEVYDFLGVCFGYYWLIASLLWSSARKYLRGERGLVALIEAEPVKLTRRAKMGAILNE